MLLLERRELVDRVEDRLLDAAAGIQLLERDHGIDILRHSVRALVPVGDGVADRQPASIDENEVHAPCVDADSLRRLARIRRRLAAGEHMTRQRLDVPAVVPVPHNLRIVEAVYLLQLDFAILHPAENVPPR